MMSNSISRRFFFRAIFLAPISLLAACQPTTVHIAPQVQPTVIIDHSFQTEISPVPTIPPYRCGAWTSNNAPDPSATIMIYARLTHNIEGVAGKQARATVHFKNANMTIDQTAISDVGGYVSFTLHLQGRQPAKVPATVDVTFTGLPDGPLKCSQAFFTPT